MSNIYLNVMVTNNSLPAQPFLQVTKKSKKVMQPVYDIDSKICSNHKIYGKSTNVDDQIKVAIKKYDLKPAHIKLIKSALVDHLKSKDFPYNFDFDGVTVTIK